MLYLILYFWRESKIISHLLHLCEVGRIIILSRLDGQDLHLSLLGLVVNEKLGIHDMKFHHEKDQATRDLQPGAIICIY